MSEALEKARRLRRIARKCYDHATFWHDRGCPMFGPDWRWTLQGRALVGRAWDLELSAQGYIDTDNC